MEYIPNSRIKKEKEILIVKQLSLPDDMINYILSYYDDELNIEGKVDEFWINLGTETCNLYKWNWYCFDILQQSFGKTKFRSFWKLLHDQMDTLRCNLDGLVCLYYPRNINVIRTDENNIQLTHIFYRIQDLIEYPIIYSTKRKKSITSRDKEYILKFIERINIYLNYLEKKLDTFPTRISALAAQKNLSALIIKDSVRTKKKQIIKTIKKAKQKVNKMSIINEVTVKD